MDILHKCHSHTSSMIELSRTARKRRSESMGFFSALTTSVCSAGARTVISDSTPSSVPEIDWVLLLLLLPVDSLRPSALRNSGELTRLFVLDLASN